MAEDDSLEDGLDVKDGLTEEVVVDEDQTEEGILEEDLSLREGLEVEECFCDDVAEECSVVVDEDALVTAAGWINGFTTVLGVHLG